MAEEKHQLDSEFIDTVLVDSGDEPPADYYAQMIDWWRCLTEYDKHELNELTRAFRPWEILLRPYGIAANIADEYLIDDYYEYCVNHEIKGYLPFFGSCGRGGRWGTYTGLVQAIPLLDPDWPPYDGSHRFRKWQPSGRLRDADLSLDRP